MEAYTVGFTPECTTLETVETLGALPVTISTLYASCVTLFDCQHIEQTIDSKVGRSVVEPSARDFALSSTLRACYDIMAAPCSLNALQAVKAKTVQTWQVFWISKCGHAHRTGYFLVKIV